MDLSAEQCNPLFYEENICSITDDDAQIMIKNVISGKYDTSIDDIWRVVETSHFQVSQFDVLFVFSFSFNH